jgi:photosystem II stability/assembly factor-like uncharacterized protein
MNNRLFYITVLALIGLISVPVLAQQLTLQSPVPEIDNVACATFIDTQHGWAGRSSDPANMNYTTDGGATWQKSEVDSGWAYLSSIAFFDPLNGWAVGTNRTYLRTVDGGRTWHHIFTSPPWVHCTYMRCVSPTEAWLFADSIYHTTDRGDSWQTVTGMDRISKGFFLNSTHGWVIVGTGQSDWPPYHVARTTDGGASWDSSAVSDLNYVRGVYFVDELHGWITSHYSSDGSPIAYSTIHGTTDGGATWTTQRVDSTTQFGEIVFTNLLHGAVCTPEGMLTTSDGGQHWQLQPSPGGTLMLTLAASSGQIWAFGDRGLILHSTDAGASFQQQNNGLICYNGWTAVAIANPRCAWIGGCYNILRTTNGGGFWQVLTLPFCCSTVLDLACADSLRLWAIFAASGQTGTIYRSDDGGVTWTAGLTDSLGSLRKIATVGRSRIWATADDGIYHSSDGGTTWTRQIETAEADDIYFVDLLNGWTCGQSQTLYHTTNGGTTWEVQTTSADDLFDLTFTDLSHGWAATHHASLLTRTTNGGVTWNPLWLPAHYQILSLSFADSFTGFVIARSQTSGNFSIFSTTTGGQSWQQNPLPVLDGVIAWTGTHRMAGNSVGWLTVGTNIYAFNAAVPANPEPATTVPRDFALSAYPNPFNPSTTIHLHLPVAGRTVVGIYDITGRLVKILSDRIMEQGSHDLAFHAADLPSGIYLIRAQTGTVTHTQKLVLLK